MEEEMEFGVVGLRKMGGNLARQALEKGISVVGATKGAPEQDLVDLGLEYIEDYSGFVKNLTPPRVVFLYVSAGSLVDMLDTGKAISRRSRPTSRIPGRSTGW